MTENERKRIEDEAEAYADSIDRRGCAFWQGLYRGYIAHATHERNLMESELKQAMNAVIDECLLKLDDLFNQSKKSLMSKEKKEAVGSWLVGAKIKIQELKHKQP